MPFALLTGPPRYEPRGQWRPVPTLLTAAVIFSGILTTAIVVGYLVAFLAGAPYEDFTEQQENIVLFIVVAVSVMAMVPAVWFAAGYYGDRPREVLQLNGPIPRAGEMVGALAGYTLLLSLATVLRHAIDPHQFATAYLADAEPYISAFREPYWPLVVPVLLLGSFADEILLRGFLLSGLAKQRRGFWPAALLIGAISSPLSDFTVAGTVQAFLISIYLSWLIWRAGNIWLPIICSMWGSAILSAVAAAYAWS